MPESQVATIEEHLLICASCREKLDAAESFALAMRRAIVSGPETPAGKLAKLSRPTVILSVGFLALLLITGAYLHSSLDSRQHPLAAVASLKLTSGLTSVQGDIPAIASARETDITLTDAPIRPGMRVEVVDFRGAAVWKGTLGGPAQSLKLGQLAPGNYFVRLVDGAGTLLHRYGFSVRPPL